MATGPAWLTLRIKISGRDSEFIKTKLLGAMTTVGTQPADGRFTKKVASQAATLLTMLASGVLKGKVWLAIHNDPTYGTGNIACVQANAALNYVRFTYGTLTITLTEGTDFARGADNTATAANLAAAINAHAVLKGLMTAAGSVGNCGLTLKIPGGGTQDITMSTDDATAFTFTAFTGGGVGTAKNFIQQVWQNVSM